MLMIEIIVLGLNDLKAMDQDTPVTFENIKGLQERWEVGKNCPRQ